MFKRLLPLGIALLLALPAAAQLVGFNARAAISASSMGDNTVVAADATKQIYVYGLDAVLASSTTLTLKCGSVALTGAMTLTSYAKPVTQGSPYWVCPLNTAFILNLGSGVQVSGAIWYAQQ